MEPTNTAPAPEVSTSPAPENSPAAETNLAGQTPLPTGGAEAAGDTDPSKDYAALLQKAEDDPEYKYSAEELNKVEKYFNDKVQPYKAKPGEVVSPVAKVESLPTEITPVLDLFKAKTPAEAVENAKKITADHERLSKQTANQIQLFEDLRAGKPQAMAYFEKAFGGTFVPKNAPQKAQSAAPAQAEESFSLPKEMFISDEAHAQAEKFFSKYTDGLKEVKGHINEFKTERENYARTTAMKQAESELVDSFVSIGEKLGGFDNAKLRQEINEWMGGKANPKMEVFGELLNLTKKHGADLDGAYLIYQGMQASKKVIEAEKKGRESAYNFKPSPPLSGVAGKGNQQYQPLTDADVEAYANGTKAHPDEWYDNRGNLVKEKIPAKMYKAFGLK